MLLENIEKLIKLQAALASNRQPTLAEIRDIYAANR